MIKNYQSISDGTPPNWVLPRLKSILLLFIFTFLVSGLAVAQIAPHVVISEVFGGGGNSDSPYKSDFVELYNPTASPVDVTGWSVQYASATGTSWTKTALPAKVIPAGGYFLIRGFTGSGVADLPGFDDSHSGISISALAGKVVLVNNNVLVTGSNPTSSNVVDKLGWGTANGFEGTVGPGTGVSTSVERKATNLSLESTMAPGGADNTRGNGFDSNDNGFDFVVSATPDPQHLGSALETPGQYVTPVAPSVVSAEPAAGAITANTATLGGDVTSNGGAKITERGVVYVASETAVTPTIGETGHIKSSFTTNAAGPFTRFVIGLTPTTKYYMRAFATNAEGTTYGSVKEFTTPQAGTNADIAAINLSSGTISPAVSSAVTSYNVTVNHYTTLLNVIPTLADPLATVRVNGTVVANDGTSTGLPLTVGENTINVEVTAEDGTTTKMYTLTVNRPASDSNLGIANHLVISEVSGGGDNSTSPFREDYVELYNPTSADIVVDGWSVQAASSQTSTVWTRIPINGTVRAKSFFLVRGSTGAGIANLTYADITNNALSFAALRAKIVLVNNNVTVQGANPNGSHIIDKVGYGSDGANAATGFEGAPMTQATTTTAVERKANANATVATMSPGGADFRSGNGFDSDVNSVDFLIVTTPNPQYSGSASEGTDITTVSTVAASAIMSGEATVGGNVTAAGTSAVTERGVVYMASAAGAVPFIGTSGAVKVMATETGTGDFAQVLSGLTTNTSYVARAYAINSAGTAYGEVVEFTTARSTNANLSGVTFSSGTMAPAFDQNTLAYRTSVSAATNSITLTPTVADPNATVTVNGTAVASGSASAAIPLTAGDNSIAVAVTAQDGTTIKTYTFAVNRAMTDHLVISEVYGGAGNPGAVFSSDYVELYNPTNTDVVMENWSIQYAGSTGTTWTVNTISGTVKAKGYFLVKQLTSSGANPVPTPDASGSLNISGFRGKVLLANNATPVTGANPTDANIVDLLGWGEANLSGTAGAANGFEGMRAPTTNETNALERKANNYSTTESMATGGADEMKGNGFDSNDNSFDFVLSAPNPQNSTSAVEEMTGPYVAPVMPTVTTTAATAIAGKSATLGGNVTANGGAKVTDRGLVYVASATDVVPTIGMEGHIRMPAATMGSGAFNQSVTILNFNTKYYVRAYATNEAGTTYGNVESFITAAAGTNADLANLTISGATLNPEFSAAVTTYLAIVPNSTTSVSVTPVVADVNATVSVNGSPVNLGSSAPEVPLVIGDNNIRIVVKAEDGTTTKTYNVTVVRTLSTNANLAGLALSAGTLSPVFNEATRAYNATVGYDVSSITVTPTVAEANATVRVNGTLVASGSPSGAIALAEGNNTITTVVTAQDGTTIGTYTVTVYRTMLTAISPDLAAKNGFVLNAIYPNPMATEGAVKFTLPSASAVQVLVYSAAGGKVMEKELGTFRAGSHDVNWMSAASTTTTLAPGVYIMHLVSKSGVLKARFVVVR